MSAWQPPTRAGWLVSTFTSRLWGGRTSSSRMSGQQPPPQPPHRGGWGRMPPSPSPVPFLPVSPYAPSPPPIMSARRLPGSPVPPMAMPSMSPLFGCPSPARLPSRMAAPGTPYIPCPRPRWPSPLPPGVPLPPGPRPYRLTPVQVSDIDECPLMRCCLVCLKIYSHFVYLLRVQRPWIVHRRNISTRHIPSRSTLEYPWNLQVPLWSMRTPHKQGCPQRPSSPANRRTTSTRSWLNTRRPSISCKVGHGYRPSISYAAFKFFSIIRLNLLERILTEELAVNLSKTRKVYSLEYTKTS